MSAPPLSILHLISSLEIGGSERLLVNFLQACQSQPEIHFTLVVMNAHVNPELKAELVQAGVETHFFNRPEGHFHLNYLFRLLKIIRKNKIRIVHAHNTGSKLWAVLCKLCVPTLKLVFTFHETLSLPRLKPYQLWLHRYWIDMNIAISQAVADLCAHQGIPNHRKIYNGIQLNAFLNRQKEALSARNDRLSFETAPLKLLHVGRLNDRVKGQDILLEALSHCKRLGLNISCTLMGPVGAPDSPHYRLLKQKTEDLKLTENVRFLTNQTNVATVLSENEVFVLPSRHEGLGMVLLEAMASGLPVIASYIDGPKELVQNGRNGLFFQPEDPQSLGDQIKRIYDQPELADRLRHEAFQTVQAFDMSVMQSRYYQLYFDLCSRV